MAKWLNKLNVLFNNNSNPYDFGVDFNHVFLNESNENNNENNENNNESDENTNTTITDTLKNFYDKCQTFFRQRMFMLYSTSTAVPPTGSTIMEWYCAGGTGLDTKIDTVIFLPPESNNG